MRQYKIYNRVNTDPSRKSEATFGCNDWFRQSVMVGTSSKNSFDVGDFEVDRTEQDGKHVFRISFDGQLLKTVTYDPKTKECVETKPSDE